MSALGDALAVKNKEAVQGAKLTIFVDALSTEALPTYSVRLEAPSYSEILLTTQTAEQLAAALTEFTVWASTTW